MNARAANDIRWKAIALITCLNTGILILSLDASRAAVELCTQEEDGVFSGCQGCLNEGGGSFECPSPWPQDEECQPTSTDNTGCEETTVGCPNNLYLWTDSDCDQGMGSRHQTTTPCSTRFSYSAATNAGGITEDCPDL